MTEQPTEHCGRNEPGPLHARHQFIRGDIVSWCPGGAAEQPVRHTADTITSDALDQLYTRAEQAERVAQSAARDTAKALTDYLAAEQRAEQVEAAITRVLAFCDELDATIVRLTNEPTAVHPVAATIRHHLAQHQGGNAEDCKACHGTNPPYPFICPGPETP